eukprot:SAG22_NODE_6226_length_883_cov_1.419643_3_plen_55_part_01
MRLLLRRCGLTDVSAVWPGMRLAVDGSPLEILSDGTESYFYGSLYFDQGKDDYAN